MLTAHPPEALTAMQGHFDLLHTITEHAAAGRALSQVRDAFGGRLPILAIFRAVLPWVPKIMANTMTIEDWLALAEAILALIPAPATAPEPQLEA